MRETCRGRFGDYPPYNMDDPDEHLKSIKGALPRDRPMPKRKLRRGIDIWLVGNDH